MGAWVDPFLHYPLTAPLHPSCSPSECQYTNGPRGRTGGHRPTNALYTPFSLPHPYALYRVNCGEGASTVSHSIILYCLPEYRGLSPTHIRDLPSEVHADGNLFWLSCKISCLNSRCIAHIICQNCQSTSEWYGIKTIRENLLKQ